MPQRHDLDSTLDSPLSSKQRQARDTANAGPLFVCGILIYVLGSLNLTLTMVGATALFIARDLRPDLIRAAIGQVATPPRPPRPHR